jgi:hypothetical protein
MSPLDGSSASVAKKLMTCLVGLGAAASLSCTPVMADSQPVAVLSTQLLADSDVIPDQPTRAKSVTLPSGVQYFDVNVGEGTAAEEGRTVQLLWVLRRSNGYFVDASSNYDDEPFIYRVGNLKKAIMGVDEGIRGMKAGGVRRMNIPPNVAFIEGVEDGKPGPLPAGFGPRRQILTRADREVWYFEIKMLKVK